MKSDPREQYVKLMDGKAIMLVCDFMKNMGISANNEMQFHYFIKSISLCDKGIPVYHHQPGKDKYETRFYTVLSTEKKQNERIVYCNTEMISKRLIEDIQKEEDASATVVKVEII